MLETDDCFNNILFFGPAFTLFPMTVNPGLLTGLAWLLNAMLFLATDCPTCKLLSKIVNASRLFVVPSCVISFQLPVGSDWLEICECTDLVMCAVVGDSLFVMSVLALLVIWACAESSTCSAAFKILLTEAKTSFCWPQGIFCLLQIVVVQKLYRLH